jgi:hypothetical protein
MNIVLLILLVLLISTTSCENLKGVFGKNSAKENKQASKVEKIQNAQVKNDRDKMESVAILASGTDYALDKVINKEPPVVVAQDINNRVISLAGKPNLKAEKEMWEMIDNLTSQNAKLRLQGISALENKDKEIALLQAETKSLSEARDFEISKYMKLAEATARNADTTKAELDKMNSWFGLGAVFYGLKKFFLNSLYIIIGLIVVFTILRFASMSNPIAASIFGIIEHIGSWLINIISLLLPKSLDKAGQISKIAYNDLSNVLSKIVDNIQNIKQIEAKTGQPITLKELLVELDKSMDQSQKSIIDKIKKELGY